MEVINSALLQVTQLIQCICHYKPLQPQSNICGQGWEPTLWADSCKCHYAQCRCSPSLKPLNFSTLFLDFECYSKYAITNGLNGQAELRSWAYTLKSFTEVINSALLQVTQLIQCICHYKPLPPQSNICGQGWEPTLWADSCKCHYAQCRCSPSLEPLNFLTLFLDFECNSDYAITDGLNSQVEQRPWASTKKLSTEVINSNNIYCM